MQFTKSVQIPGDPDTYSISTDSQEVCPPGLGLRADAAGKLRVQGEP